MASKRRLKPVPTKPTTTNQKDPPITPGEKKAIATAIEERLGKAAPPKAAKKTSRRR